MAAELCGWSGKILKVDLTSAKIVEIDTMDYADRFLGGRGIATRLYWEEVRPNVGALAPDNRLILMTGPLGATGVQGASRFEVVGKSPMLLPERFCYGNLGGYFAPYLKMAGYDGISVSGRAERLSYVLVTDGKAEIRDAAFLRGRGVSEVRDALQARHGKNVHFVTTGLAGENLCRSATLMTDHEGSATGGFGAVLGSKNLKAIAVVGSGRPPVARRKELTELIRLSIHLSKRGTLRMPLPKKMIQYTGKASCYQCGLDCLRGVFRTASGKEAVRKCQSLVFYMPYAFMRPDGDADTAVDATALCNEYSICTMEMTNLIEWIAACHRAGVLSEETIGLDMSGIGSGNWIRDLVRMIAAREGLGDVLAEGILRAGERLGPAARALFTDNMAGVGLTGAYAPREYITNALLYALEPRQPIAMLHEVSYMMARWLLHLIRPDLSPTTAEVFRAAAAKFWGSDKAWDLTCYEGKARAAAVIQDRTIMKDSLILCDCAWPIMDSFNTPDHLGDPTLESRLFSAVTGIDTDEPGLRLYGERAFNQQRAILLREGWRAKEQDVPAEYNFIEPLESDVLNPRLIVPGPTEEPVSIRGNVLDRRKFEEMRREYYTLRGWDPATGLQKKETLVRLGMGDVAEELEKAGLIA
jgi:aldehyde:ferredoxin oxidoreductase